jgi:hypothetical protein
MAILLGVTLDAHTMKTAKEEAMKEWGSLDRHAPVEDAVLTLGEAIEQ